MTDADNADDLELLSDTPAKAKYQLHNMKQVARDSDLYIS